MKNFIKNCRFSVFSVNNEESLPYDTISKSLLPHLYASFTAFQAGRWHPLGETGTKTPLCTYRRQNVLDDDPHSSHSWTSW